MTCGNFEYTARWEQIRDRFLSADPIDNAVASLTLEERDRELELYLTQLGCANQVDSGSIYASSQGIDADAAAHALSLTDYWASPGLLAVMTPGAAGWTADEDCTVHVTVSGYWDPTQSGVIDLHLAVDGTDYYSGDTTEFTFGGSITLVHQSASRIISLTSGQTVGANIAFAGAGGETFYQPSIDVILLNRHTVSGSFGGA